LNNPLRYIDPDGHQTTTADALKAGATLVVAAPHPVAKVIGVVIIVGVVVEKTVGWENVGNAVGNAVKWFGSGNTAGDGFCGGCASSERMGQSLMNNSNSSSNQNGNGNNGQSSQQSQTQSSSAGQAGSGGQGKGGSGKSERKVNKNRAEVAKKAENNAREQLDKLKSRPNKTPEDKAEMERLKREIQKQLDRQKKSESHDRKGKGN